uniref:Uncharacterized protein n=1 Tax=Kalanchoe fedtschenkoi TaxID=63787 RepID=A0A7N0ZYL7_KALFE
METSSRKRCREDLFESEGILRGTKRMRPDAGAMDCGCAEVDESGFDLPELLLLGMLEEPVETGEAEEDLDSVMRSFEEEIMAPATDPQPELGFLLEASDAELGLPPPAAEADKAEVADADVNVNFGEVLGFEDDLRSCDLLELGFGDLLDDGFGEVVEGLGFDDALFGNDLAVEKSEFVYRPESLPAV